MVVPGRFSSRYCGCNLSTVQRECGPEGWLQGDKVTDDDDDGCNISRYYLTSTGSIYYCTAYTQPAGLGLVVQSSCKYSIGSTGVEREYHTCCWYTSKINSRDITGGAGRKSTSHHRRRMTVTSLDCKSPCTASGDPLLRRRWRRKRDAASAHHVDRGELHTGATSSGVLGFTDNVALPDGSVQPVDALQFLPAALAAQYVSCLVSRVRF